jgi:hypothetical protein
VEGQTVGHYGLGVRYDREELLVNFCKQYDKSIANTFQNTHRRRRYTWKISGDIARYQIDYILVRKRFRNQIHRCKTYPGADADSDHNLIMMKCNKVFKKLDKPRYKSMKKWNFQILKDTNSARTYAENSNDKLENLPQADSINNK